MGLEVTELIENEVFEYSQIDGPYPLKTRYTLASDGSGTLVVAIEESSPPGIYYKVMHPLVKWAVTRRLSGDLADLKVQVEMSLESTDDEESESWLKRLLRRLRG